MNEYREIIEDGGKDNGFISAIDDRLPRGQADFVTFGVAPFGGNHGVKGGINKEYDI